MSALIPGLVRWLPTSTPLINRSIAARACVDIGLVEEPPGSNRSPTIDSYLNAVGTPLGSPWCAAAVSAWFRDCGAVIPAAAAGSCESWHSMGKVRGRLTLTPQPGYAVLYDLAGDGYADHMGVVVRTDPLILTVEANTIMKRQAGNEREGVGCTIGMVLTARVISYIIPEPIGVAP